MTFICPAPGGDPNDPLFRLLWAAAALAAALWAAWALSASLQAPTVYRAWPSGACRAVAGPNGAGSCSVVPPVHHTVWVSPDWGRPR